MYGKKEKEATVCSSENHIDNSFSYGLIVIIVYTNPMCGIVSCFKVAAAASKLNSWRDGRKTSCVHPWYCIDRTSPSYAYTRTD